MQEAPGTSYDLDLTNVFNPIYSTCVPTTLAMILLCTIMGHSLLMCLFLFALLFAVVQADYIMDDSNSTIRYTSEIGSPWGELTLSSGGLTSGNGSSIQLDYTRMYNETA